MNDTDNSQIYSRPNSVIDPLSQNVNHYQPGASTGPKTTEFQVHKEYLQRYPPTQPAVDLDDPRILRIRHELRAEVQRTIANELAKLRLFLSKYYLKDIVKAE